MSPRVRHVTVGPESTQQQWDRHLARVIRRRLLWRALRSSTALLLAFVVLVLLAAPLAFG